MDEITDIKKLKAEDMPATNEDVSVLDTELLLLHYNCRSLVNKADEITKICDELNPGVVSLTETWFDNSVPQTAYIPEGYRILRNDRSLEFRQKYGKTSGGGTAILFRKDLKVRSLNLGEKNQETQWVELKGEQKIILGVVYRAHYTDLLH